MKYSQHMKRRIKTFLVWISMFCVQKIAITYHRNHLPPPQVYTEYCDMLKFSNNTHFQGRSKIAKSYYYLRYVCPSASPSAWKNSAPTGRIFVRFHFRVFFENLPRRFKVHWSLTRITNILHEELCTYIYDNISLNSSE